MKRILSINGSASPLKCGVGYYGEKLVPELAKHNDVHVLTSKGLGSDILGATEVHHVENWKIKHLYKIISIIRSTKPDIVHIQYPTLGYKRELGINLLPLALRILLPSMRVVVTLHEYHESALLGKIRNIITVLFAHKIIVSNKLDFVSLPKLLQRKMNIIPIGTTFHKFSKNRKVFETLLSDANLSPDTPTIAYFGFINPNKGIETLIKAAKNIHAQVLLLAALDKDSTYHSKIDSLITQAKKEGAKIHVAGFLENEQLSQVLQECKFFVLPQQLPLTAKSSTAIVAAEHGLLIVSKSSNVSEHNLPYQHNTNTVLLDEMDEKTLVTACNNLLTKPEKLKQMQSEISNLESYFSWESIAQKHNTIYTSIIRTNVQD